MPFGSEVMGKAVRFSLWAPAATNIDLCLLNGESETLLPMQRLENGCYQTVTDRAAAGSLYYYLIDKAQRVPDPASRYQPEDVHGPSQVIDPAQWDWQDTDWQGRPWNETVIYELHTGSFSPAGNFQGISERLDYLQQLGITAIELMPVADFSGERNWGYDGVLPYAPDHRYGGPDALKLLVEAAHARNLMVILDVVYNHFGPDGNYLHLYAPDFFTDRYQTPWGKAINFDGDNGRPVRDFFIHNALYWLEEFHLDGLRLDAVHSITDKSGSHILEEMARTIRAGPGRNRHVHLILENDNNESRYLHRNTVDIPIYNAQWNDDMHHAMHVLLTDERHGYYQDYADRPLYHLGRTLTQGFSFQGEISPYRQGQPRGTHSRHLRPGAFVTFLQNHDQVGNRAGGERIGRLAGAESVRAMTAILLLAPSIPLVFMGQEYNSSHPFPYFCDYAGELGNNVSEGRRREFSHFPGFSAQTEIPDPNDPSTFDQAKLDWDAIDHSGHEHLEFFRQLLQLRQRVIVPLLDQIMTGESWFRQLSDRGLAAGWALTSGRQLQLYANLQSVRYGFEPLPAGNIVYTTHPGLAGRDTHDWPAWFVAWMLNEQ